MQGYMLLRYCPPTSNNALVILPERAAAHRIHQHFEHVLIVDHRLLQAEEHGAGLVLVPRLELAQALQLALLFLFGRADQLDLLRHRVAGRLSGVAFAPLYARLCVALSAAAIRRSLRRFDLRASARCCR
jgi:hypothetical protein